MENSTYYNRMHRLGIWMTIGAMAIFFAVPWIICTIYDIMPKFSDVMLVSGGILAIFIPMSIAETIAETPVMGTSYYLTCITGNILNIKLPATLNALKVANVKSGTEAADAVTGIAVAASSLVTMAMITLGVLLLTPLKPLLTSDVVNTAVNYVLPALFGCMALTTFGRNVGGGVKIYGRMKAAVIPFIIALLLFFVIMPGSYESWEGIIAALFIPVIYFSSKYLYKKGKITVEMPEESQQMDTEAQLEEIK